MILQKNVKKRKRKTVFLFILICVLSSSFFAQNFIQDNKNNDIINEESTFDNEILKELKISSYSQTFEDSGNNTDMVLQQSYVDSSFNTILNTSIVNGNNFTLPSPTDVNFNSTFTKATVEGIIAPNKNLVVEDDLGSSPMIDNANSHYISFEPKGIGFINNISIRLRKDSAGNVNYSIYLYNATQYSYYAIPDSPVYAQPIIQNEPITSPQGVWTWFNFTNIDKMYDSSNTYNNLFFLRLFPTDLGYIDCDGSFDSGFADFVNESIVLSDATGTLVELAGNTIDVGLKLDLSPIYVQNKTLIIEDTSDNYVNITESHYTSFRIPTSYYLTNLSIELYSPDGADTFYFDVFGALNNGGIPKFDISKDLTGLGSRLGQHTNDSSTPVWFNLTGLDQFLDVSETYDNYFFINVSTENGLGRWSTEDESNGDDTYSYNSSDLIIGADFTLKVGLRPIKNTVNASDIGLKINNTNVIDITDGQGYWESNAVNGSDTGYLDYNVTADWWDVQCNITQVQINYTKDDIQAITQFTATTSSPILSWNVSRTIDNFDSRINNTLSINFTLPESWDYNTYQVFNGSPSEEMTSYSYNRSLGNGDREICITNGSNGKWYVLINSTNQINSIDTYVGEIPYTTMNYTNTVLFNTTLGSSIAQDNGLFNLSIFDPNSILNFTQSNSTFNSGTEIYLLNWTISNNVTDYGIFPVQLTWTNGTEVGYKETNITIIAKTKFEFDTPNQYAKYNASNIFNITANFTDIGLNKNITDADIQYKINDGSISTINENVTYIGYSQYNITFDCNNTDFDPYGINNITIFANKSYHYNQSKVLYIIILAETNYTLDLYPDITNFDSDETFNITVYFNNTVRNQGINKSIIIVEVDGGFYLNSSVNVTRIIDFGNGYYNITVNCSDSIFTNYGPYTIEVNMNKSYHYNQTDSFPINITGKTALTVLKFPDKNNYGSEDLFNITAYYNDTVRNQGIIGANITVEVDGNLYLNSSVDPTNQIVDIGNGYYNITVNCSDTDFKYYGEFNLRVNASKIYYYSQSNSSLDPIIIGNTTLNILYPSNESKYESDQIFNITVQYNDVIQSKGIPSAIINYSIDENTLLGENITYIGNGEYNITIYLNHTDFNKYGFINIQIIASKLNHTTLSKNLTIDRIVTTTIDSAQSNNLGSVIRGLNVSYTFNYTDTNLNPITQASGELVSSSYNFIYYLENIGTGNYTMHLDTSNVNIGTYDFIFNISSLGNETQIITLTITVSPTTTGIFNVGWTSMFGRHIGANQTVRFSYIDTVKSQGITSLTTANILVHDETGENSTLWQRGAGDHNWTLVNIGGGIYDLRISTSGLSVGIYTLRFQIINLANHVNAERDNILFYLRGYYTTFSLMSLADEGGQLFSNSSTYNYSSYIRNDLDIRFNITNDDLGSNLVLEHMDSYSITYTDLNNNSITGTINNSIIFNLVNDTYGYFIGTLNLTQANLTAGYYQFDIAITKTNFEGTGFSFNLTLLPRYSISVSIDSFLDDITAGEDFWIAFNVSIILNSPTEPLEGALVILTPIIDGIPENQITETTNSSGIVVFEFTIPSDAKNLSLSLTLEGEFNYESKFSAFSDFTVNPPKSEGIPFEVILTYLIIFAIAIGVGGGSLAVYKGVVVPKKREKARILMEVKTIFDDAINLEHILILYKGTGTCIFFKSFGSEQVDPELISGFISAISSFGKDLVSQEELNEITYGDKMLLISDGEFTRAALVLGKKASLILRKNTMEFINVFEKTYDNELPNWRGQLNIFRSAGTIIDEMLSTSIILPHEISYEFSNVKSLKTVHSRDVLKIANHLIKDTERKFFFIATLLKEATEKTSKDTAEIFMGIKELRDQRILIPIEISAIEAPPISQQEINLIDQKITGLVNLSPEEKQKLINDLAQIGPAEREAYFSSMTEQEKIVTAPLETKPEAAVIENIKKAKKEIKKLRKNAFSAKKKKDYENSIKIYQNAEKLATDWELSRECHELDELIRMTKIEDFKIKKVNLEKEAKLLEKAEKYEGAAQKYKASSKMASEIFKLGVDDMTKEVKRLTNKFRECEKLI